MQNLVGSNLGRYRVLERIALGGMAAVYLARQPGTEREVAIKVLPPQFADDPALIARFEREAKLLAELQHPHILPIFDFGREGELLYYVAPLLRHGDLNDYLARWGEALPLPDVRRIMGQLCDALDYAHSAGIVHRDLKPANVLLDARGNCLLSDFGIAKHDGGAGLTGVGHVIGTPEYMSPEQGDGSAVDRRSDIYALGVIAYQLATGVVPFKGPPAAVIMKHQNEVPTPPRTLNPAIPLSLEAAILRALAKRPEDRYANAAAFGDAIRAALPETPAAEPTPQGATTIATAPAPAAVTTTRVATAATPAPTARGAPVALIATVAIAGAIAIVLWAPWRNDTPAPVVATAPEATPATPPAQVASPAAPMPTAPAATSPPATAPAPSGWREDFATAQVDGALPEAWMPIAGKSKTTAVQRGGVLALSSRDSGGGVWIVPGATPVQRVATRVRLLGPASAKDASIGLTLVGSDQKAWVSCYLYAAPANGTAVPTCTDQRFSEFVTAPSGAAFGTWQELALVVDRAAGRVQLEADGVRFGSLPAPPLEPGWYLTLTGHSGDGNPVDGEFEHVAVE